MTIAWAIPYIALSQLMMNDGAFEHKAEEFLHKVYKRDKSAYQDFDSTVKAHMTEEQFLQLPDALFSQYGKLISIKADTTVFQNNIRTVILDIEHEKGFLRANVSYDDKMKIAGFYFNVAKSKVEYTPPPYSNENIIKEVEVEFGDLEYLMSGTLTLPKSGSNFPAVILVHGSGPNDRDETIGGAKVFKDLAWGLASNGVAVLRYDKRTYTHGEKLMRENPNLTLDIETTDDAVYAVEFLRSRDEVSDNIFVLGHSLGGIAAPRIAVKAKPAGIIIMAGFARKFEELLLSQYEYLFTLDGEFDDAERKKLAELQEAVVTMLDPELSLDTPASKLPLGAPASYWLDIRNYNPAELTRELELPVYILQGERDYQVTMEDFALWKKVLAEKKNVSFKSYPKLNHLFIPGEGKSTPSEYSEPGHVAPYVITDISKWIKIKSHKN